jgi:glucose uptake protein
MALLIGLIPALFWGIYPVWLKKLTGGNFLEQVLGTSAGIFIAAIGIQAIFRLPLSPHDFILYFLSGFLWNIGQVGQCWSFMKLGVSAVMPVTTALQVIGNSLVGAWLFGEWHGWHDNLIGLVGLVIVLAGVFISNGMVQMKKSDLGVYGVLLITSIGYWSYSGFPHFVHSTNGLAGFFPQAMGMFCGGLLVYLIGHRRMPVSDRWGLRNITAGLVFAVASSTYLISLRMNGLVSAFVLTQLNVVIATIVGAIVLHEKSGRQLIITSVGLAVLIAGVFIMVSV